MSVDGMDWLDEQQADEEREFNEAENPAEYGDDSPFEGIEAAKVDALLPRDDAMRLTELLQRNGLHPTLTSDGSGMVRVYLDWRAEDADA